MTTEDMKQRILAVPPEQLDDALMAVTTFRAFFYATSNEAEDAYHAANDASQELAITVSRGLYGGRPTIFALSEQAAVLDTVDPILRATAVGESELTREVKLMLARRRMGLTIAAHDRGEERLNHAAHYGERGHVMAPQEDL